MYLKKFEKFSNEIKMMHNREAINIVIYMVK